MRIKPLNLPKAMIDFLNFIPAEKQWKMMIFGGSFSGKSTFSLYLATQLSRFGEVLYGNLEESVETGTIQKKLKVLNTKSDKLNFLDPNTYDNFIEEIETGKYKYVVMDSLSEVANTTAETIKELDLSNKYKDVSFIFVLHADKDEENYIGSSKIKHKVDITIRVSKGSAIIVKNRFAASAKNNVYNIFGKKK